MKNADETMAPSPRLAPEPEMQLLFRGCLLGGAVGDALGAPVEFLRRGEILRRFGPEGIRDMAPAYGRVGAITDDTQMALFTAEGVLRAYVRAATRGICSPPGVIAHAYQRWLHTQGGDNDLQSGQLDSWLLDYPALHSRRAPGLTCLSTLEALTRAGPPAKNDSKGCGGIMRVAPIGMLYAAITHAEPDSAAPHRAMAFDLGCEASALTHGHPTGQLAAGAFAAIVCAILQGMAINEASDQALELLGKRDHHEETSHAMREAMRLAIEAPRSAQALTSLGEGWIAEEALAIGLYCALCAEDFGSALMLAVNHDGDSDSTGLIAGSLLGAALGVEAIPPRWLEPLELRELIEEIADDLATAPCWPLDEDDEDAAVGAYYWNRYPGH